jgi:hypothetical protein
MLESDRGDNVKFFEFALHRFGHHSHMGCQMAVVGALGKPESIFMCPAYGKEPDIAARKHGEIFGKPFRHIRKRFLFDSYKSNDDCTDSVKQADESRTVMEHPGKIKPSRVLSPLTVLIPT